MSKIGIGADQQNSKSQPSSGWQLGYAWATTYAPTVSTTQRQDKSISSVVANAQSSGLAPSISTSSSLNQNIQPSVSGAQASALGPSVQTSGAVNIAPPVGQASATTGNHSVSTGSVINTSISSVIAGATASAGTPSVSVGSGGTSYYLQTDGVDDVVYYNVAVTIDEVILDCVVSTGRAAFDKYIGNANGAYYQRNGSSQDQWAGAWSAVYVNGASVANNTASVPLDTRITIRLTASTSFSAGSYLSVFANNITGAGAMPGKLYRATFKNAGVTIMDWDFTTGTTTDQSGNGRTGVLNGCTWVVA